MTKPKNNAEGLRQRKKKDSDNSSKKNNEGKNTTIINTTSENAEQQQEEEKEQTLLSVFLNHPLVRVAQFIVLPYLIFQGMNYVSLQHPEYINFLIGDSRWEFRPAIETFEERQVLILGATIADNKKLSTDLSSTLALEIAHEIFDSQHYFCRDGTTSWYQIMRFVQHVNEKKNNEYNKSNNEYNKKRLGTWKELCIDRNSSLVTQFFHPKYYLSSKSDCSTYEAYSNCWSKDCFLLLQKLWDCNSKQDDDKTLSQSGRCKPPFRKILHQTQYPLATIEKLNQTYCQYETIQSSFQTIISGMFPYRDYSDTSCIEMISWYVLDFENTLLNARHAGVIDNVFQIENTSPCEVATLAGFIDPTNAMYMPHLERITKLCHPTTSEDAVNKKTEKATSKHVFVPKIPKMLQKKKHISWEDLESDVQGSNKGSNGEALIKALKKLAVDLGYTNDDNQEGASEFM